MFEETSLWPLDQGVTVHNGNWTRVGGVGSDGKRRSDHLSSTTDPTGRLGPLDFEVPEGPDGHAESIHSGLEVSLLVSTINLT